MTAIFFFSCCSTHGFCQNLNNKQQGILCSSPAGGRKAVIDTSDRFFFSGVCFVFAAMDTTKDPCQNVKCSRHKVCVAQGYQRAMCVNRKKVEHRQVERYFVFLFFFCMTEPRGCFFLSGFLCGRRMRHRVLSGNLLLQLYIS